MDTLIAAAQAVIAALLAGIVWIILPEDWKGFLIILLVGALALGLLYRLIGAM